MQTTQSVMTIYPYKDEGMWVFDEPDYDILKEPFVCGMGEIIDEVLRRENIQDADYGFACHFSALPFTGASHQLTFLYEDTGGAWYRHTTTGMEGWLCPVLYMYFDASPGEIFVGVGCNWFFCNYVLKTDHVFSNKC